MLSRCLARRPNDASKKERASEVVSPMPVTILWERTRIIVVLAGDGQVANRGPV